MRNHVTNKNFTAVLDKIKEQYEESEKVVQNEWVTWLDQILDELLDSDFFGTEGQLDPRGDQRS